MPDKRGKIAVVGGANVDIGGFPAATLVAGDSNPGCVRISMGGVGRNIAENAARMGLEVSLTTALGDDANGRMLLEDCRKKGIGTEDCFIDGDGRTSVYLFIDDARGDMYCSVNDMEIQSRLTPERIAPVIERLNEMDAVVMDANLPEETICYLAQALRVPLFADAVSVAKAGKLRGALEKIHCLKPNRIEAEMLTGVQIRDVVDAAEAAKRLNDAGVRRVYLSMGLQGALCAEDGHCTFLPCPARGTVNATGAGDAFTAALVWAHCEGMDLRESGIAGMAAAAIAAAAVETVSPEMSRKQLMRSIAEMKASI